MIKKYCVDTSALSNPLEHMPEDIHVTLWGQVERVILSGCVAATREIYDEMIHITGRIGACIAAHPDLVCLEVGDDQWNWAAYLKHVTRMRTDHEDWISEYNSNRKSTVGLNDISIIAMGLTLNLPVVSMEKKTLQQSTNKRKIPDVCAIEGVKHMSFSDFLRQQGIQT